MSFVKLFSNITESSLWCTSKETRLLFVAMLAKADSVGFVEAAIPGLARIANLNVPETEKALAELEAPDPYSKNPDFEGRRIKAVNGGWLVLNYEHYRNRRDDEQKREYMRQYMREYRKDCKLPVNSRKTKKLTVGASRSIGRSRSIEDDKATKLPATKLSKPQRELADRIEAVLGPQWRNDAGKWVNRVVAVRDKSERVIAEVELAARENRIQTTPAQYAEQVWKEFA